MSKQLETISLMWQEIAERLRRPGAIVGLFGVLLLGMFEPLACVIHCSFLELISSSQIASAHHHHHVATAEAPANIPGDTVAAFAVQPCPLVHSGQSLPNSANAAPQPFHEMLLLTIILLVPALAFSRRKHPPTGPPHQAFVPPLSRPPIVCQSR